MQIEKKLILCSILAVAIGIAAIVPVAYFMNNTATAQTIDDPWFNLNLSYATAGVTNPFGEDLATYRFVYNYTVNPDAVDTQVGGKIEFYRLQIYSDKEQLANTTAYLEVNCAEPMEPDSLSSARDGWFNLTRPSIVSGTFFANFNGTLPQGVGGSSGNGNGEAQQIQAIRDAQSFYIDVHRVGYVTCTGNNTVVTLANDEVIQHIELTKSGDQFVYGVKPFGYALDKIPGEE
jgi:hypothetical protein